MKKLKIVLHCNYFFYFLFILSIIFTIIYVNFIKLESKYNINSNYIEGIIISNKIDGDKLTLTLKAKEKVLINYYFKTKDEKDKFNLKDGDYIKVNGTFTVPKDNTNFNLFNYKKFLYNKKIFFIVDATKITKIKNNTNILYKIKNMIDKRINKCTKTKAYIKAFIIGNKSDIDVDYTTSYQSLGISHLFAISGMHVAILTGILLKILSRVNEKLKYFLVYIFLTFYLFFTNFSPSIIRASILFILYGINKVWKIEVKTINLIILLVSILLFINPLYIFDISFQFSFIISFSLVLFKDIFENKKYISKLFIVSLLSFLISLPIVINNFYQINIFSVIYNLFYVPYISFIVFPIGLLTFIFPIFDSIYFYIIHVLELSTKFLLNLNTILYFSKLPLFFYVFYYYFLFKNIKYQNRLNKIVLILIIIFFYNYNKVVLTPEINFIDVGQGDSTLIRIYDKNILIDTGGKVNFNDEPWKKRNTNYSICNNVLLPYFKSIGIKKIDYLILTHGDYDHMGESYELIEKFKVKNIIINDYNINDNEKKLVTNRKYKRVHEKDLLKIYNNSLLILNPKNDMDDENLNSIIIYTKLNKKNILLMGDAGITNEKRIINEYNLEKIDILKVGHHGSDTSSSFEFLKKIKPDVAIISVGENNRYNHPSKSVIDRLDKLDIKKYRTDEYGSIKIKFYNKLKIKTCLVR